MVSDLTEGTLAGHPLEALMFGGAPAHDTLPGRAQKAFPDAVMYELIVLLSKTSDHFSMRIGVKAMG